jgi:hypothetical protein
VATFQEWCDWEAARRVKEAKSDFKADSKSGSKADRKSKPQ